MYGEIRRREFIVCPAGFTDEEINGIAHMIRFGGAPPPYLSSDVHVYISPFE